MTAPEDEFLLKWHDHHHSFFLLVEELVMRDQLTDVTLACASSSTDQQLLSAHSLMLSVCSPYFRTLLSENKHKDKHHIIHLHGVSARHMQQLLVYMYRGEISISQEDLGPLIETAKCLQIKGLAMAQTNVNIPTPSPTNSKKRSLSQLSPTLETSPSSSTCSNQQNKTKKSKIKHISCIEEPVVSSQELIEPIKGEISEEKEETIGENKEYISELQETIFNQKTLSLSSPLTANVVRKKDINGCTIHIMRINSTI